MGGAPDVRRVVADDAARLRALRIEMLADAPLAFLETLDEAAARPHEEFRRAIAARATGDDWAQFVADDGRRLVGHAAGMAARESGTTLLVAVYVTPAHRGTGLLERLVEAVAHWSRAAGRHRLALEVVTGNNRAVRAYERLGFVDTGTRSPHPRIPVLTELTMTREC
ncbi:MAG TPA: GNAT family N-acetyltransferase [Kribbellaceae bacterium]|nr:GNAT family N-acetyltransferase [Kribbellaceae bacterium]